MASLTVSGPAILALGSTNVDFQVRVDRWPEAGETMLAREFVVLGGGKAANVALFARRAGIESVLIARVGDDFLSDLALAELKKARVELSPTREVRGAATGLAMISVRPDGDKAIILASNANLRWQQHDAEEAAAAVDSAPAGCVLVANLEIPAFVLLRGSGGGEQSRLQGRAGPFSRREHDAATLCARRCAHAQRNRSAPNDRPGDRKIC